MIARLLADPAAADWFFNLAAGSGFILLIGLAGGFLLNRVSAAMRAGFRLAILSALTALPVILLTVTPPARPLPALLLTGPAAWDGSESASPTQGIPLSEEPVVQGAEAGGGKGYVHPAEKSSARRNRYGSRRLVIGLVNAFGITAALGFLVILIRLVFQMFRINRFRNYLGAPEDTGFSQLAEELGHELGMRRPPPVFCSPRIPGPLTLGVLRPVIVLPRTLMSRLRQNEARAVLLHEAAHIRHRDPLLGLMQRLLRAFYWWNPLIHRITADLSRDREEICDNYAIRRCGAAFYARFLTGMVRHGRTGAPVAPACGLAETPFPLERRLRGILDADRSLRTGLSLPRRVLVGLAMIVTLGPSLRLRWTMGAENAPSDRIPLSLDSRPTSIRADDSGIFVTGETGISFFDFTGRRIARWGARGEGPGRYQLQPHLTPLSDRLWINDFKKIVILSRDGALLREIDLPFANYFMYYPVLPIGDGYIGFPWTRTPSDGRLRHTGTIYDREFRPVREFYSGPAPRLLPPPRDPAKRRRVDVEAVFDCLDYTVHNDRIYVADSRKGLHVEVFDAGGERLYEIHHPHDPIPMSPDFRRMFNRIIEESPGAEEARRWFNFTFRETFPAFFSFKLADGHLFLTTFAEQANLFELVTMDLDGGILERSFVFPVHPLKKVCSGFESFASEYDIRGGKLYRLIETRPGVGWHLEIIDLD